MSIPEPEKVEQLSGSDLTDLVYHYYCGSVETSLKPIVDADFSNVEWWLDTHNNRPIPCLWDVLHEEAVYCVPAVNARVSELLGLPPRERKADHLSPISFPGVDQGGEQGALPAAGNPNDDSNPAGTSDVTHHRKLFRPPVFRREIERRALNRLVKRIRAKGA